LETGEQAVAADCRRSSAKEVDSAEEKRDVGKQAESPTAKADRLEVNVVGMTYKLDVDGVGEQFST
jgi:hypothetical protein